MTIAIRRRWLVWAALVVVVVVALVPIGYLVSLAVRIGAERAVASAVRGVGGAALVPVLPLLQPAVLSSTTRRELRDRKGLLDDVRRHGARHSGFQFYG